MVDDIRGTRAMNLVRSAYKRMRISQLFAYNMTMTALVTYLDSQLARGRAYFTNEEALAELRLSPLALKAAITRLTRKQRLANLRHGFYLIRSGSSPGSAGEAVAV